MRAIKFRGKDAKTGEWRYGYYCLQHMPDEADHGQITTGYQEVPVIFNDKPGQRHKGGYWHEVISDTVGQFTGLIDECEKDVYEGDIIVLDGSPELGRRVVVYYEEAFNIATEKERDCLLQSAHPYMNDYAHMDCLNTWSNTGLVRIIGNIHDNPELLNP